jgi:hypothetical protein
MMNNLPIKTVVKVVLVLIILGSLTFTGFDLYRQFQAASQVDFQLIEAYRPNLSVANVKKAAEVLSK